AESHCTTWSRRAPMAFRGAQGATGYGNPLPPPATGGSQVERVSGPSARAGAPNPGVSRLRRRRALGRTRVDGGPADGMRSGGGDEDPGGDPVRRGSDGMVGIPGDG